MTISQFQPWFPALLLKKTLIPLIINRNDCTCCCFQPRTSDGDVHQMINGETNLKFWDFTSLLYRVLHTKSIATL